MLHILKKISFVFILIFLIGIMSAAYYTNDPTSCPSSYQSQTCSGSDLVCGYSGGVTFCYDMSIINAPGSSTTSSTSYSGSYDGGYLIDCYAYDGSEPHCDNSGAMWCDRDSTCYNVNRITQCEANKWSGDASDTTCTTCRSGYTYCDGSYTDGDGCEIQSGVTQFNHTSGVLEDNTNHLANCSAACDSGYLDCDSDLGTGGTGCEVQDGGACSVGSLSGTYSGCTCVVDKSYFQTGTFIEYLVNIADGAMLWFKNWGTGDLINATNVDGSSFRVDNETNVITSGNMTATYFLGDGSLLSGITATESDPYWTANWSAYNSTWTSTYNSTYNTWAYNQTTPAITYADATFITLANEGNLDVNRSDYWDDLNSPTDITGLIDSQISNVLTINASGTVTWSALTSYPATCSGSQYISAIGDTISCSAISITESQISDLQTYYLRSNPFGFYNSTNPQTETDPLAYNGTLMYVANWNATNTSYYLRTNPFGFYNSTDFDYTDYRLKSNNTFYGDIGINTATPQNTLNVIGDGNFTEDFYIGDQLEVLGEANFSQDMNVAGTVTAGYFVGDGSGLINIIPVPFNQSFNRSISNVVYLFSLLDIVVLGNTTVSHTNERLEIYENATDVAISIHEDYGTHDATLLFRRGGDDWQITHNQNLSFEFEEDPRLVITQGGNVGINTTSPATKLDVVGIITATGGTSTIWNTWLSNWTAYNDSWSTDTTYIGGDAITLVGTTFNFDGGASPGGDLGGTWVNPSVDDDSHNHVYSNIDATTSANWATRVSDETGTGKWVFSDNPTFTTGIILPADSISDDEINEAHTFEWTGTHTFAASGTFNDDLIFADEIKPDNALCDNNDLLFKTGADNWDCKSIAEVTGDIYLLNTGDTASGTYTFRDVVIDPNAAQVALKIYGDSNFRGTFYNDANDIFNIYNYDSVGVTHGDIQIGKPSGQKGIYYDASSGFTGLGIVPAHPLHLSLSGDYFSITDSGDSDNDRVRIGDSSGNGAYFSLYNEAETLNVLLRSYGNSYFLGGNVGIGTASPSYKLEVYADGADSVIHIHEDAGTHNAQMRYRRGSRDWYMGLIGSSDFTIDNEGVPVMTIKDVTGNVGIGDTTPGSALEVTGNITLSDANNCIIFNSGGKICSGV